MNALQWSGLAALAYTLGAIPFGVLVARAKGVDIQASGSGNIGATNVWRTLGKGPGALVFALDTLKGAVPAGLALALSGDAFAAFGIGIVAVLGHSLSPFLRFKGGKGVATGFGALLGSAPGAGLGAFALFLVVLGLTRYVSLASILAALSLAPIGWALGLPPGLVACLAVMGLFVIYRHRENIKRLRAGTERKFSFGSSAVSPAGDEAAPGRDIP